MESSKRAGWIELCRLVGLYAVVMLHVEGGHGGLPKEALWGCYISWNGLFFMLAAYFMGRSGAPMMRRAGFFLKFYFVWNALMFLCKVVWLAPWQPGNVWPYGAGDCIRLMLGMGCEVWNVGGSMPWDYPLWFLRDLMMMMVVFSFLRSLKARWIGSVVLCGVSCVPQVNDAAVFYGFPALQSWLFFCTGLLLAPVGLDRCRAFLMRYGALFVAGLAALAVFRLPELPWLEPFALMAAAWWAVMAVLSLAVWICAAVPAVGRWSTLFSPAFFFIYASHALYLGYLSGKGIDSAWEWSALALSYMVFAAVLYRLTVRFCPYLAVWLFARPMRR